ncbi:MAG: RNA 2',3'-cyclic phosphodiesterase [Bacteroidales bacterium]|nr:RNA 2',3'-cyclic phosphodiesterase [Bacteroidales bacterium]
MKRLFIAIDLSDVPEIVLLQNSLKNKLGGSTIYWTKPENQHITLKFLGNTALETIPSIEQILNNITQDVIEFTLHSNSLGIFGSSYKPRIIWLSFEDNKTLGQLAQAIHQELIPLGYEVDRQNFVPHLTLGRIRKIDSKRYFQQVIEDLRFPKIQEITIDKIYLYESILKKSGAEYQIIEEFSLRKR